MPKSTPKILRAIETHAIMTIIFTDLLITPIISSLLASSPIFADSKYPKSFHLISFEVIIVKTRTNTANMILIRSSVEKSQASIAVVFFVCSISEPETTALTEETEPNNRNIHNIIRLIIFVSSNIYNIYYPIFDMLTSVVQKNTSV
jgi:hypothetical protein